MQRTHIEGKIKINKKRMMKNGKKRKHTHGYTHTREREYKTSSMKSSIRFLDWRTMRRRKSSEKTKKKKKCREIRVLLADVRSNCASNKILSDVPSD